jgi:hypothetical protein
MPLASRTGVADRESRLVHIRNAVSDGDARTTPLSEIAQRDRGASIAPMAAEGINGATLKAAA